MEGTNFIFWNWTVAVYLFVAGVSAGAFAISALAYLLGREQYGAITRVGAYIAPFPLIFGLLCLIYDLERPYLFWKLIVGMQGRSIMSLGSWLLVIFSVLSFLHFYLWLPDPWDITRLIRRGTGRPHKWSIIRFLQTNPVIEKLRRPSINRLRGAVAFAGIPVALLVGVYTGLLLSVLSARPFWNNPVLPMLFLVSALKTGTASICLVSCFFAGRAAVNQEPIGTSRFIHSVDAVLMLLSVIAIPLFVFGLYVSPGNAPDAGTLIMGGEYTFLFWGMAVVVGIAFPLSFKVYELIPYFNPRVAPRAHHPWALGLVTLCVLLGGFVLRYVIVYAGQV
jgi:protein NrfD